MGVAEGSSFLSARVSYTASTFFFSSVEDKFPRNILLKQLSHTAVGLQSCSIELADNFSLHCTCGLCRVQTDLKKTVCIYKAPARLKNHFIKILKILFKNILIV